MTFLSPRQKKKFLSIPIFLVLFFIGHNSWACGAEGLIQFPKPSGPYSVGYKNIEFTDHSRPDSYEPDHSRRLKVTVYYPSRDTKKLELSIPEESASWNHFLKGDLESKDTPESLKITKEEFESITQEMKCLRVFQSLNASPAPGMFPVVLFEHGFGCTVGSYQTVLQNIVSHGYVVLAIGHPSMSGAVLFKDGTEVFHKEEKFQKFAYKTAYEDAQFVLTKLPDIKEVVPSMNLEEIGMMGHSLGGSITIKTIRLNPHVKVGVSLDAPLTNCFYDDKGNKYSRDLFGDFPLDGGSELERPFLFIVRDDQSFSPSAPPPSYVKILLGHNNFRAMIRGAKHRSFSDDGFLKDRITVFKKRKDYLDAGLMDFSVYQPQLNQLILSFFDRFLKKNPVDLMKLSSDIVVIETGKEEPK